MDIPSLEHIIDTIFAALLRENVSPSRPAWTKHVATALAQDCPRGCVPYGQQFAPDHREYLCDQVWAIEDDKTWESYAGLALAMECEWISSDEEFLLDFCKLLDVAATRRVFIGNLGTRKHWPKRAELIDTACAVAAQHRHFIDREKVAVFLCEQGGKECVECWTISGEGKMRRMRRSEDC